MRLVVSGLDHASFLTSICSWRSSLVLELVWSVGIVVPEFWLLLLLLLLLRWRRILLVLRRVTTGFLVLGIGAWRWVLCGLRGVLRGVFRLFLLLVLFDFFARKC